MSVRRIALTLALAAFAQASHAALFDDEEARKRIADTNARLAQVQKQLDDRIAALEGQLRSQGLVDLFNSVEQIKSEIARLRGQVEVLTHELEQAQKRQRDLYVDLDSRVRKLESAGSAAAPPADPNTAAGGTILPSAPGGGAPGAPVTPPPAAAPPVASGTGAMPPGVPPPARPADPAAEQRAYDAALDQFKRGDYPGSIASFSNFVRAYPQSALAPSAQYWVGNAYYARKDYRASIAAQRTLISVYPSSNKVPDALLNIASAQSDLNDNAAARRTLEELMSKYPQTEAALKARQRLGLR
ncbi:MAG: tol-pal system protein YbgF [Casimicrobiaceae bacterium]